MCPYKSGEVRKMRRSCNNARWISICDRWRAFSLCVRMLKAAINMACCCTEKQLSAEGPRAFSVRGAEGCVLKCKALQTKVYVQV